jgi:transcriptional regulator with XRE-family HTH domain
MSKTVHRPEYAILTEYLRAARLAAGLHQSDIAAALDRTQSFVSDVENGSRRLDLLELRDVCRVVGVDFLDFIRQVEHAIQGMPPARGAKRARTQAPAPKPNKKVIRR